MSTEGASNETAAIISTIPKLGGMVVFIRFALLISPEEKSLVDLLMILSIVPCSTETLQPWFRRT